ncbi:MULTISPECIES: hypothetical protein [unclassified Paraflavitalea]|uniref:hypothetical protein n=1 Tax=unclassified Paraflavitalea TaxID=2798305 RepID=UPI003D326FA0
MKTFLLLYLSGLIIQLVIGIVKINVYREDYNKFFKHPYRIALLAAISWPIVFFIQIKKASVNNGKRNSV